MNVPILISEDSYQEAWAKAMMALKNNRWSAWNVVVQIRNPEINDQAIFDKMTEFANKNGLVTPKMVEHTIFPSQFYRPNIDRQRFYRAYWKYFRYTRHMAHRGWGTYFERMIFYNTPKGNIDQLGSIIDNINNRGKNYQASHTIVIPYPHRDRNKLMGAPCLNYITVQAEKNESASKGRIISLLAVYRNHDFTVRTYGNYLGLCKLLIYICSETNSNVGALTCVSSHADVKGYKDELIEIAESILGVDV